MRICGTCKIEKDPDEFYNRKASKDGLAHKCKKCASAADKAYRYNNVEAVKRYGKEYYKNNKKIMDAKNKEYVKNNPDKKARYNAKYAKNNQGKIKAAAKDYSMKNKAKISARMKRYYDNNIEIIAVKTANWKKNNKEKHNAIAAKYRSIKLNAVPLWVNHDYIDLFYKGAKMEEVRTGRKVHVDHIVPLQGKNVCGLHVEDNLQLLFAKDNITKSNRF